MTKVFISYSRKDKAFAEKLNTSLKEIGFDSWIDWIDIPPTADWRNQIQKGIESADAFLFLLSPDSVISKVCGEEIDHAVKNNKRMIPLVVRDVNADDVHSDLAKLNWILFREQDDFETSLKKLEAGIKTDLPWVESHRRLQVRAIEWERRKDRSLLLRGRDLREAEEQLASAGQKDPQPTDLQRQYVLESRRRESQTRNIVLGIAAVVAISLALLTLFAFRQRNTAIARQLAAQAQTTFLEENYNAAALYAYQSNLISNNETADEVLDKTNYENFTIGKSFVGHSGEVYDVAWSPDGRLASTSFDQTIIIWDLATRRPDHTILHGDSIEGLAWSNDGRLASAHNDATVVIWNLTTGTPAQTLRGHTNLVTMVAWSDDNRLASASYDGTIIVWDIAQQKPDQILKGHDSTVQSLAWSADGLLASGSFDGIAIVWDLGIGQPLQRLTGQIGSINAVAWSNSGSLASASSDGTVILWDLTTGQPDQVLREHTDSVESISWSADGQLVSASKDRTIILWNLPGAQAARILRGHTGSVTSIAWSEDGQLASGSADQTVIIWEIKDNPHAQIFQGHAGPIRSLEWSTNGQLASGSADRTVRIWEPISNQPRNTLIGHTDEVVHVAWSKDNRLASASNDGTVIVWDLERNEPAQILRGHSKPVGGIAWSPDGRLASTAYDETIIWDLANGRPDQVLAGSLSDIAWSNDGRLAYHVTEGQVTILDPTGERPIHTLSGFFTEIQWIDNERLATDSGSFISDSLIIWNLRTGQPVQTLTANSAPAKITDMAWSSGGYLASASGSTITIWDITSGNPVATVIGHRGAINGVAWSEDGLLSYASEDGTISIPRNDFLGVSPCNWIFRNMTFDEWREFRPLDTYQPACPNLPYPTFQDPLLTGYPNVRFPAPEGFMDRIFVKYLYTWSGRAVLLFVLLALGCFPFIVMIVMVKLLRRFVFK